MKKRALSLALVLCFMAALCACGGGSGAPSAPTEAPGAGENSETAAPTAEDTPEPSPEGTPVSALLPEGEYIVTTMELGRLYAVPVNGGAATILADKYTNAFSRYGDILWAVFEDGEVRRFDLAAGTEETLDVRLPTGVYQIVAFDGGFIGESSSLADLPTYWVYRESTGSATEFSVDEYMGLFGVDDGAVIYESYHDDSPWLRAVSLDTGETLWEVEIDYSQNVDFLSDGIYLLSTDHKTLQRLDTASHTLEEIPVTIEANDSECLYAGDGAYLVQSGSYNSLRLCLLREGKRTELDIPGWDKNTFIWVDGSTGSSVLLRGYGYKQSAAVENLWYDTDQFFLLHLDTGSSMPVSVRGEYGSLFAAGDFPVMDSSTARQPVVNDIYTFFCESSGAGGNVPLCSTTHGAWLNMADRTVDVALLAAPTQEEQDYLASQGTEVEMKLYGGDGLVFIGSGECGVTDLTLDQVRGIYSGEITNWSELGGVDAPITVLYRDDQSGSQRLFERLVWGDEPVPDPSALGFTRLDEMSTLVHQCLNDPYAIGYSIMTYLKDVYGQEDLLAFSLDGVAATPENVAAETYPLSTRGYVVIRADEPEDSPARRLYDWFGSPLCDYILTQNGVTPLSE